MREEEDDDDDDDDGMGENDLDSLEEAVDPSNTQMNHDDNDNKAIITPIVLVLLIVGWHISQPLVEHIEWLHGNDHGLSFPPPEPSEAKVFVCVTVYMFLSNI
eukprot:scaffold93029_cov53-Attheya_sp.AAC.2